MYAVLPKGTAVGPRYFVQITTKAIASFLQKQGVQIIIYIDDTILVVSSVDKLIRDRDRDLALHTFKNCGFTVNFKKSQLILTWELEFLGFMINSLNMTITLTDAKCEKLWHKLGAVLRFPHHKIAIKRLAQLIGQMIATLSMCDKGFLHYRSLERFKIMSLHALGSWKSKVCLSEMEWWCCTLSAGCPYRSIIPVKHDTPFYSDASKLAWGWWL